MNVDELIQVLNTAQKLLPKTNPFSQEFGKGYKPLSRLLFAKEPECREEIERSLHCYFRDGVWTPMSDLTALFVFYRIQCALDFLLSIREPSAPVTFDDTSEYYALTWLCKDLWIWRGPHWLKMMAIHLGEGDGFYDLDPLVS